MYMHCLCLFVMYVCIPPKKVHVPNHNYAIPSNSAAQFVHVTGTKGKGTVCELVRCGLVAHGKRVGTFTRY